MLRRLSALAVLVFLSGAVAAEDKIAVLIVSGKNNHDCAWTSAKMKEVLDGTGRFSADITSDPAKGLGDAESLKKYKAFVLDYNGPRWGEPAETNFLEAVKAGTGVSVIHAANNAFTGWVEYEKLVGDCWRTGTSHGKFHAFDVKITDHDHPITKDLPDLTAHPDELYHNLVHMHDVPTRVLATAFSSKESNGSGKDEPMIVVLAYGKGRIFHTPLGHVWPGVEATKASHNDPPLQLLIVRGTEWAATGACTIKEAKSGAAPAEAKPAAPEPVACKCGAGCGCGHCKSGGSKPCKCGR